MRPTLVIITNENLFFQLSSKLSFIYKAKQEYTDVWILGITNFSNKSVSEIDKKIIDTFFGQIVKYRADNSLPLYDVESLEKVKVFMENKQQICKYLVCNNKI